MIFFNLTAGLLVLNTEKKPPPEMMMDYATCMPHYHQPQWRRPPDTESISTHTPPICSCLFCAPSAPSRSYMKFHNGRQFTLKPDVPAGTSHQPLFKRQLCSHPSSHAHLLIAGFQQHNLSQ
jgi:hypothetical protein